MVVAFHSMGWQSGKDTAADYMEQRAVELGATVARTAFAWPMKLVCAEALGIEGTDSEKVAIIDELKLYGGVTAFMEHPTKSHDQTFWSQSGRDFIIGLAEGIRSLQRDFWIRQALDPEPRAHVDIYLLADCRFDDEAIAVHQRNGVVIEVIRDEATDASGGTRSEKGLSPGLVDFTVDNNGTLDQLAHQIFELTYRLLPARLRT